MARLTVALLPTNMLRGMLHGEGDKPAAATSAAARHARLRCEEHARLRGGAREAHVPFVQYICVCMPVQSQYTASTRAHAARLLCVSQPIITLVAALAVTRVAWATVRATGGRSEVAGARCTRVQPPTPPCVAKGCRLQAKGCRLQPPYDAGLQVAGVGRPVAHRRSWPRSSLWPAWAASRAAPPCRHRGRGYAECLTPS